MKTIVENIRENIQDTDFPQKRREWILEGLDEMLKGIDGALEVRED